MIANHLDADGHQGMLQRLYAIDSRRFACDENTRRERTRQGGMVKGKAKPAFRARPVNVASH
jgi:hypothetical protein